MANPQAEDGHIRIAREIAAALMRINLSSYQYRLLWMIWSKTYGWGKSQDWISLTSFEQETGIDRRHIVRTIKELTAMNIIKRTHDPVKIKYKGGIITLDYKYGFQKDFDKWVLPNKAIGIRGGVLPNKDRAIASIGNEPIASIGTLINNINNLSETYSTKLSDKETLSAYLLSLPEYQNIPSHLKEPVLTFIDKVRQENKTKVLAPSRAEKVLQSFKCGIGRYTADHTLAGINAVFSKEKKNGFKYSLHDPTAYVWTVAKGLFLKDKQQHVEQQVQHERAAMKQAPASGPLMAEIDKALH